MDYSKVQELVLNTKSIVSGYNHKDYKLKGKADFVTDIDLSISSYLKEELYKIAPQTGFFSEEESGSIHNDCWILDPIDGTTNLVYGYNMSSVSLAHYKDGDILFGIVYNPFSGEIFTAKKGEGAYLNGEKRLSVSSRPHSDAIIEFGAGSTHKDEADKTFRLACDIFKECIDIRRICSTALSLCFIADGRIDGYFEKVLKPWDIAAGSLIIEEAGGMLSDYSGRPLSFAQPTSVIAGNKQVHAYLEKKIRKA